MIPSLPTFSEPTGESGEEHNNADSLFVVETEETSSSTPESPTHENESMRDCSGTYEERPAFIGY